MIKSYTRKKTSKILSKIFEKFAKKSQKKQKKIRQINDLNFFFFENYIDTFDQRKINIEIK